MDADQVRFDRDAIHPVQEPCTSSSRRPLDAAPTRRASPWEGLFSPSDTKAARVPMPVVQGRKEGGASRDGGAVPDGGIAIEMD